MIKTVLVPGVPWPKYEPPPKKPKQVKKKKPTKTNLKFDAWAQKHNINFDFLKDNNVIRKT